MTTDLPSLTRAQILLPLFFGGPLDYAVPLGMDVAPGDIVLVTLNRRPALGVVWDGTADPNLALSKLKPIVAIQPPFRIEQSLRRFIDWVANYTLSPPGQVLALALRANALAEPPPPTGLRAAASPGTGRPTEARARVLTTLADRTLPQAELARAAGVSAAILRAMQAAGWLVPAPLPVTSPTLPTLAPAQLNQAQSAAAAELRAKTAAKTFSVTLLRGATGSGKTEVYFEAIQTCLEQGRQALVLLPEIALSAQWLARFAERFGAAASVWHSDLPSVQRRATWRATARGFARVVVGARSALFLPFADLGLIVVDEEHESAFKQEDGVIYHARDMAVVRARLNDAAIILASATPSLESLANVESGRYAMLDIPQRYGGAALPSVAALDLRQSPPERGSFLAPPLIEAIAATLAAGEQAMLFLNRRGYAPLTLCRACGHRIACPNCTAWLVEHRLRRILTCHHCGHTAPIPPACPACGTANSLTPIGPGVERITEEAAAAFPTARRLVMASDTMPGPHAAAAAAGAIERNEVDLIIGTQIVAKGWHFPNLTLVGVVDADLGLSGGDLRAGERTFQLLHQVAGRAGRASAPGRVLLQTYQPDHPVMRALIAADADGFMRAESAQRRPAHWPPYGRLAALIVNGASAQETDAVALALARAAPRLPHIVILGPAPAPLALLRGRHRRRLLLRAPRDTQIQPLLRAWLTQVTPPRSVRIEVDIDPMSFL